VIVARHDPYQALRSPGYVFLLAGGVTAATTSAAQTAAVAYELWKRTESMWVLGLSGLVQFVPVLLFALPAGMAADHFPRKTQFQLSQFASGVCSAALAWLSYAEADVNFILTALFFSGVARAFTAPARTALLPQVVPLEALPNAVAWNSSGWQLSAIVGPALGGGLIAFAPPMAAYLVAAGGALLCVLLLVPMQPEAARRPIANASFSGLFEGLQFVFKTPLLLSAITLDLFAVLLGGATALLPYFADILDASPFWYGLLRAAPAIGAVLMAFALAHLPPMKRPGRAMMLSVVAFGVATIIFGVSTSYWLSFACLFLLGAFDNVSVVVRHTLVQTVTPDEMRGRVSAVNTVFISSSNELGEFESGVTAAWFGAVPAVVGGGVGTILVVGLVGWFAPSLWRLGPLAEAKPAIPALPPPPASEGIQTAEARGGIQAHAPEPQQAREDD
jgi:MFS family permease